MQDVSCTDEERTAAEEAGWARSAARLRWLLAGLGVILAALVALLAAGVR